MKAYMFKNYEEAKKGIETLKGHTVAIEAEWGDMEIKGNLTLNHHGANQNNYAPSVIFKSKEYKKVSNPIFIFSHLDLDSIIGAMWINGDLDINNETHKVISEMVAKADVYGPHTIVSSFKDDNFKRWITLGWLINRNNLILEEDITGLVKELSLAIKNIINSNNIDTNPLYIEAYEWFTKLRNKAKEYIDFKTKYITGFISSKFMLANYNLTGILKPFLIQYHTKNKRISVSAINEKVAKYVFGDRGLEGFMQEHFGEKAGGKISIAGTPKNEPISLKDYNRFKKIFRNAINEKLNEEVLNELISM